MGTKICARCKQELDLSNFYIAKNGRVNSYCKTCDRERKKNNKPTEPPTDLNFYKTCSCCGQKRLATQFNKHKWRKDGLSTQCKTCDSIKQSKYAEKYKNNSAPETKLCIKCQKLKPASDFTFSSRSIDKLSTYCKDCNKKYAEIRKQMVKH